MKDEEVIKWARRFESGDRWLDTVLSEGTGSIHTEGQYARNLKFFCDMVKRNPDELIAERNKQFKSENPVEAHKAEKRLRQAYLKVKRSGKRGKAVLMVRTVKSFYKHNFVPLSFKDPKVTFAKRAPIAMDDLKLLYNAANPRLKSWMCILKDTGLSRGDVLKLKYGQIQKAFEKGEQFIPIHLIRGKTQVEHDTFLGPNAVEALKLYFRELQIKGETITGETPLINASWTSLGKNLERFGKKYGVKISCHRIRKFFETALALGKVHPLILKYWMGHKISGDIESHYLIPTIQEQLTLYKEAYKNIDLTAASVEARVEAIEEIMASIPSEQREKMQRYGIRLAKKTKKHDKVIEEAAKIKKESENEDCPNGEHCSSGPTFKEISEVDLLEHLEQGWRIEYKLGNGQVIVKRGG